MNQAIWVPVAVVAAISLAVLFFFSFDTLEYQEYGLNFSRISETVERKPYTSGRYYLGIANHFIRFPRMVNSVLFSDEDAGAKQGPALQSRTRDGLNVRLEVSFQYRLKFEKVYDLYSTLGKDYEPTFLRMAIEQLATAATDHSAHFFFTNRTAISAVMHQRLNDHFQERAFSEVPFFQLRTVHLPHDFEEAIRETQVKQQDIQIATLEQKTKTVTFKTRVLQAEQDVKVLVNQPAVASWPLLHPCSWWRGSWSRLSRPSTDVEADSPSASSGSSFAEPRAWKATGSMSASLR